MKRTFVFCVASLLLAPAQAKTVDPFWSIGFDKLEQRYKAGGDLTQAAEWSFNYGGDELQLLIDGEYEYDSEEKSTETIDTIVAAKFPVSGFYDGIVGVRLDTPDGKDQHHFYLGIEGLASQFVEIQAGLSLSEQPSIAFEAEYEGLITNWITLTPSLEILLPVKDNPARDEGGWGPKVELGLRLSYDAADRTFSPYIGIHQERLFGETGGIAKSNGKSTSTFFTVVGVKLLF